MPPCTMRHRADIRRAVRREVWWLSGVWCAMAGARGVAGPREMIVVGRSTRSVVMRPAGRAAVRRWRHAAAVLVALFVVGLGCGTAAARPAHTSVGELPPGASDSLAGVSCAAANYCMAVGIHITSNGNYYESISELWNGVRWTTKRPVQPAPRNTYLYGVSCPAVGACYAVGTYDTDPDGHTGALVEFWNGGSWQVQSTPDPAGGNPYTSLTTVSCASVSVCVAAGAHSVNIGSSFADHAITERWNGTRWTLHGVPHPARSFDALYSVSCPEAGHCQAVGTTQALPYSQPNTPFAEGLSATTWSIEPVPSPTGPQHTPDGTLYSVYCAAAAACEAVGGYDAGSSSETGWAARWDGTAWTTQPTAHPSEGDYLTAVSCPAASQAHDCEAVGDSGGPLGYPSGLIAELWNGTAWTTQPIPNSGNGNNTATAISCVSATDCEAVGAAGDNTLGEHWDGSQWAIQATTNPTV
jgi:hypothetical protein